MLTPITSQETGALRESNLLMSGRMNLNADLPVFTVQHYMIVMTWSWLNILCKVFANYCSFFSFFFENNWKKSHCFIFKSSSRFTEKLNSKYSIPKYSCLHCPHTSTNSPIINILPQRGIFVIVHEPALTYCQPKSKHYNSLQFGVYSMDFENFVTVYTHQ